MVHAFHGVQLYKNGELRNPTDLDDKTVGVYFGSQSEQKCRDFNPLLKKFYEDLKKQGADFEIVFASGDNTEDEFKKHISTHGDWYSIGWEDLTRTNLQYIYAPGEPPAFVIIKPSGEPITLTGADDVKAKSAADAFKAWTA